MTVNLKGVSRKYGNFVALGNLDLVVEKGEFLTLLGPSGSGKTTLLNIIAGMISPSSGRIEIDGCDVTDLPTRRRGLGMVFQHYALMPHMTVFENIAFPLRVRRVPEQKIRLRVEEVLDTVNLRDFSIRKPRELSGGQQQRVAIARCLVYEPRLILMDEPLGALDKKLREQLQIEIKRLHADTGVTILYVTHDQEEALALSDRIMLMNSGRVEQLGTPHELYFSPRTMFAAQFLGESNVFTALVLEATSKQILLRSSSGVIFKAAPANIHVGTEVTAIIRPENIIRLQSNVHTCNRLSGEVIDTAFVGGTRKYYIRLDIGEVVVLKELTNRDPMDIGGNKIEIGWSAEDTIVIPLPHQKIGS